MNNSQQWTQGNFPLLARLIFCHDRLAAKELSPGDPIQPTVAENTFVQVIMLFRKTFIQDSVPMMELHPCYPIWQHSIFSDPAYMSFKRNTILSTHSSNKYGYAL
ncbi:hypothetical protein [Absidia glauca]|uniref:Ndc10 domain-containing protein n=1 Tax=Absidia glauca TaxID=4829 RepID=A0A168S0W1_ABSGL|nr:hypothetical protein [Absidia glauca]